MFVKLLRGGSPIEYITLPTPYGGDNFRIEQNNLNSCRRNKQ